MEQKLRIEQSPFDAVMQGQNQLVCFNIPPALILHEGSFGKSLEVCSLQKTSSFSFKKPKGSRDALLAVISEIIVCMRAGSVFQLYDIPSDRWQRTTDISTHCTEAVPAGIPSSSSSSSSSFSSQPFHACLEEADTFFCPAFLVRAASGVTLVMLK
jgi:hypothetical protein